MAADVECLIVDVQCTAEAARRGQEGSVASPDVPVELKVLRYLLQLVQPEALPLQGKKNCLIPLP